MSWERGKERDNGRWTEDGGHWPLAVGGRSDGQARESQSVRQVKPQWTLGRAGETGSCSLVRTVDAKALKDRPGAFFKDTLFPRAGERRVEGPAPSYRSATRFHPVQKSVPPHSTLVHTLDYYEAGARRITPTLGFSVSVRQTPTQAIPARTAQVPSKLL